MNLQKDNIASLAIRLGLATVFLFAATTSLIHPDMYYKYVPGVVSKTVSINLFLTIYGMFEILLAIWLLTGKLAFYSALISAALLFVLTMSNLSEITTLFRNIAIVCSALALAALSSDSK